MEITRDDVNGPIVSAIGPGGFRVADRRVPGGLILLPDNAHDWKTPKLDAMQIDDIAVIIDMSPPPEFLLLGTGDILVHPPARLRRVLDAMNVGLEVMDSRAAVRTWGLMRAEERWIGAAIYPLATML